MSKTLCIWTVTSKQARILMDYWGEQLGFDAGIFFEVEEISQNSANKASGIMSLENAKELRDYLNSIDLK